MINGMDMLLERMKAIYRRKRWPSDLVEDKPINEMEKAKIFILLDFYFLAGTGQVT